mmetsp:Transcript_44464/g.107127  ORF Transcript_44464/g.107127 Transcript_44464/m.107127 type:complete len:84 (+) Transcript_44464:431-682(+)
MNKKMIGNSTKFQRKNVKLADSSVGNRKISMGSRAEGTKGATPLYVSLKSQTFDYSVSEDHQVGEHPGLVVAVQNSITPSHLI